MRRLHRFLGLLLLALWLPATEHCNLEAAGLIATQCTDGCDRSGTLSNDGCGVIENGSYRSASGLVKAPAPALQVCASFLLLQFAAAAAFPEPVVVSAEVVARPADWVTTWQFVRRAAPPSRAPSLLRV